MFDMDMNRHTHTHVQKCHKLKLHATNYKLWMCLSMPEQLSFCWWSNPTPLGMFFRACRQLDKQPINWCRGSGFLDIFAINGILSYRVSIFSVGVCVVLCAILCTGDLSETETCSRQCEALWCEHFFQCGTAFLIMGKKHTPWKINMEPTNHPFRKENDLPNLHYCVPCYSSGV